MPRVRKIRRRRVDPTARKMNAEADAILPSRFNQEKAAGGVSRVVIVGSRIFNVRLAKLLESQADLSVVATASTPREALAAPNEHGAEMTVIDVDFGGTAQGILLARTIGERSPGCAIMLVCGALTETVAKQLWVYGADSWSVISSATAKSAAHVAEAVSSAVHGITWVEPGVKRAMAGYGPRPRSLDERKLFVFDAEQRSSAA
ncbi:MAG: response regulator [Chloroflexi bacterium]|nr:response regulator [Chloroflexota bacterium]